MHTHTHANTHMLARTHTYSTYCMQCYLVKQFYIIVSSHQPHDCLLKRLFRHRSKKTSKLRVTGLCAGNSPGTGELPAQMANNAENVSIWWRHHVFDDIITIDHGQMWGNANSTWTFVIDLAYCLTKFVCMYSLHFHGKTSWGSIIQCHVVLSMILFQER